MVEHVERVTMSNDGGYFCENPVARNVFVVPNARKESFVNVKLRFGGKVIQAGLCTICQIPKICWINERVRVVRTNGDCGKGNFPDFRVTLGIAYNDWCHLPLEVRFENHTNATG